MNIDLMLKALGDPTRFSIFSQILLRKHCVRSLAKKTGISESAVSQHMKVLREAGLVYGEKFGYHTHYLPKQEALNMLANFFDNMKIQSLQLDRTAGTCSCEYRKTEENK